MMDDIGEKELISVIADGDERPFVGCYWSELREIAGEFWDDPVNLYAIWVEAKVRCRKNATSKAQRVLDDVAPRLEELLRELIPPEPDAQPGTNDVDDYDWPQVGVLKAMGYEVGELKGKLERDRRKILENVFFGPLVNVFSYEYMAEWGDNASPARLRKMAWSIASFANNRRRKLGGADDTSVSEWKADLDWIKLRFYKTHFGFPWPPLD